MARSWRRTAQRAATAGHAGRSRLRHDPHAGRALLRRQVRTPHICSAGGAAGLALEFGVFKGTTINHLAKQAPDRRSRLRSFTGLPEHWTGPRYSPVNFERHGKKPKVAANVS